MGRRWPGRIAPWTLLAAVAAMCVGCGRAKLPATALVFTQTPVTPAADSNAPTVLDERYPAGSRVVLLPDPAKPADLRVLSKGLLAAGGPVISADAKRVLFAGKAKAAGPWQIYEARSGGGSPRQLTTLPGGAMDPTVLASGEIVFSSPVPAAGQVWSAKEPAALYSRARDGTVRRLTFGASAAMEPTVLNDGRILFVSAKPEAATNAGPALGLYTINNDGTEVAAYALDRDGAPWVSRPRELQDGRVGFIAAPTTARAGEYWAEGVRTARPFLSRQKLFPFPASRCRTVEPGRDGSVLASLETRGLDGRSMSGSFAIFEIAASADALGAPLFDDPAWHDLEAMRPSARPEPLGHISAMSPTKGFGTILCLNGDFSRDRPADVRSARKAVRVRVTARADDGGEKVLGEAPLQRDGSFMAEVPVDRPLGFESLDDAGAVIQRLPPRVWIRAGENRTCIGCHEPYNHSPRNRRPVAVYQPIVKLSGSGATVAQSGR